LLPVATQEWRTMNMVQEPQTIPELTLGVAVYDSERFLPALFRSLESSSRPPGRILFIDDFSADSSASMVRRFAEENTRLRVDLVVHRTNAGVAATYNHIVSECHTEYLQILDADDRPVGDYFRIVKPFLEGNYAAIITGLRTASRFVNALASLCSAVVPSTLPQWIPILGSVATRSGTIYKTSSLRQIAFPDPVFDGSDILHLVDVRRTGTCRFVRSARVFYSVHAGAATARLPSTEYDARLRSLGRGFWLYRVDLFLRKRLLRFLRVWLASRTPS